MDHRNQKYLLKTRLGLSLAEYAEMSEWQGHQCAICGRPQPAEPSATDKSLAVDHDHETGQIRGLLCMNCNVGIGRFQDDPDLLLAACAYLLDSRARQS